MSKIWIVETRGRDGKHWHEWRPVMALGCYPTRLRAHEVARNESWSENWQYRATKYIPASAGGEEDSR